MAKSPTISHKRERSRAINTENENTFVFKLYDEDGTEVVITSAKEVAERVVSKYFKTSDFKSFTRQLHLYGFSRSTDGRKDKTLGGRCKFFHRHFRRNNPELLHMITRVSKPKEHTASKNMSAGQQFTTGTFRLKPVPKEKTGMQAAIVLNKTTSPWTSISPLNDISTPKNSMMPVSPVVYIAPAPTLAPASNADQTLHNFQQCIHPTSVVTTVSMPTNHISMQKQTVGEPRMQKAHSVLSALQILSDNIVFLDQNNLAA
ncbi:hypothetical protein GGI07_005178 [Coemansia sp. Benny D115]|nr:hypothetical protein GGI07_005178 [Coemansia sp. Benny D115]